jgi:hypothetical protein
MTPILSRDALEGMRRVDIQKLCAVSLQLFRMKERWLLKRMDLQDNGIKANLSTANMIDLLLHGSK